MATVSEVSNITTEDGIHQGEKQIVEWDIRDDAGVIPTGMTGGTWRFRLRETDLQPTNILTKSVTCQIGRAHV